MENFRKESKNISKTAYNKETKELFVTFKSFKDPESLTTYKYEGVPEVVWNRLKEAPSLGGFINKEIVKGKYPFVKI